MKLSSPRFKSLSVTAGFSFWFFIIITTTGNFSFELFFGFVASLLVITQIFSSKVSKILDIFAMINTKIFLGILFVFVISIYGILFKVLKIDLLRLKKTNSTYWLEIEKSDIMTKIKKQY
ncbi:MAG: hypothetical protein CL763_07125 [Chloroflexi bacterium]|nr:hypothetical protein [Chloroflexota bacterium]|tara:strand:+ start:4191 stop:4550 length:360 start_codon:yes stop_codon:yes gene_type:complete